VGIKTFCTPLDPKELGIKGDSMTDLNLGMAGRITLTHSDESQVIRFIARWNNEGFYVVQACNYAITSRNKRKHQALVGFVLFLEENSEDFFVPEQAEERLQYFQSDKFDDFYAQARKAPAQSGEALLTSYLLLSLRETAFTCVLEDVLDRCVLTLADRPNKPLDEYIERMKQIIDGFEVVKDEEQLKTVSLWAKQQTSEALTDLVARTDLEAKTDDLFNWEAIEQMTFDEELRPLKGIMDSIVLWNP